VSETLADQTCGFLPVHLYEGLELERAKTICHAINSLAMASMGLGDGADAPKVLRDLSLRDMLDALETVERWNDRPKMMGVASSVSMVPAERLIAAAYTLMNFHLRPQDDEDDLIVRFDATRWGEKHAHLLIVARRDPDELDRDQDEDDEAEAA